MREGNCNKGEHKIITSKNNKVQKLTNNDAMR